VKEQPFKSEKELQSLCENNLQKLINLDFVDTEFSVADFRLDTVAYDKEAKSFVIIEYKNQRNVSVIDQGYTYLSTMFNHKADFVLRYNIKFQDNKDLSFFDWSQSRVIFISPNFTKYQINSINFKDLPIELWKIKKYQNNTVSFEQIISANSDESIKSIAPVLDMDLRKETAKEAKTYSEKELVDIAEDCIVDIYNELKEYILGLDDSIILKPNKLYIGFNRGRKSIVSIKLQKNSLILWLNTEPTTLNDPKKIIRDVSNIGHHGNGNSEIKISNTEDIGYIEDLLKRFICNII
jgi:predicted transport protein